MLIDTGQPTKAERDRAIGASLALDIVTVCCDEAHQEAAALHGDRCDENAERYDAAFDSAMAFMIRIKIRQPVKDETRRRHFWKFHNQLQAMSWRSPEIHDALIEEFHALLVSP